MKLNKFIDIRDWLISNFFTSIIGIVIDDNLNKNYYKLKFINFIPYFITKLVLNKLNVPYLFKKDDIIFYSINNCASLGPILLALEIHKNGSKIDIKDNFSKYHNNVPIFLIFNNENIKIEDSDDIYVKSIRLGKLNEKKFNYKKNKLNLKIQLLK